MDNITNSTTKPSSTSNEARIIGGVFGTLAILGIGYVAIKGFCPCGDKANIRITSDGGSVADPYEYSSFRSSPTTKRIAQDIRSGRALPNNFGDVKLDNKFETSPKLITCGGGLQGGGKLKNGVSSPLERNAYAMDVVEIKDIIIHDNFSDTALIGDTIENAGLR